VVALSIASSVPKGTATPQTGVVCPIHPSQCRKIIADLPATGTALNKSFLRLPDIPNGGFPKHVSKGEVNDVVDALFNAGILDRKLGDGNHKYGLKDKSVIEQILADFSFSAHPLMFKFFLKATSIRSRYFPTWAGLICMSPND